MIDRGRVMFDWKAEPVMSDHWNAQPMVENYPAYGDRGPYRITGDALRKNPGMALLLTEVTFDGGHPVLEQDECTEEVMLVMAGMLTGSVMCQVVFLKRGIDGKGPVYMTSWVSNSGPGTKVLYKTIEAAMVDFCKELMLVNPYDHIKQIIGEGVNRTYYQSNEEFASWA